MKYWKKYRFYFQHPTRYTCVIFLSVKIEKVKDFVYVTFVVYDTLSPGKLELSGKVFLKFFCS